MLYELAEEAKREISKYSDNYEIYLENTELLQLDSQKTDLNFAKEDKGWEFLFCSSGKIAENHWHFW